jgi:sulfonate transport system substrate-binding protein
LLRAALLAAALALVVASCSSDASTRSGDKSSNTTTTVVQVKPGTAVPRGTTLRVGDQLNYLKNVLELTGQDANVPYTIEYSSFIGGPPMLQAFQAGALDIGFVGSTPLIFAQAANQPLQAVARWETPGGGYQLLTAPGVTGINGFADIKGKKVAFQEGTASEAALLQALDKVGLKRSDIQPVNLPITQIGAGLESKSVDVGLLVEPLTSSYLAGNPTAKIVGRADEVTDRSSFIIATAGVLQDDAKQAATADFITRLVKASAALRADPSKGQELLVKQYNVTPQRASELQKELGITTYVALPEGIVEPQQRLADLFQQAGRIPTKVDVKAEFDTRFNEVVTTAGGSEKAASGS